MGYLLQTGISFIQFRYEKRNIYLLTSHSWQKSGGLRYMDLKTGTILQPILENSSEGFCSIHADFSGVIQSLDRELQIFRNLSNYFIFGVIHKLRWQQGGGSWRVNVTE